MAVVTCVNCGAKNRVDERATGNLQAICGRCGAKLTAAAAAAAAAGEAGESTTKRAGTGKPITVTDDSFARDVLGAGSRPVLLDCWAEWCGPCRMIAPSLNELAAESGGRYLIAKLNVDENRRTSAQFGIQSIPTLLIFKNGQLVERIVGAQPKQAMAARLAAHV